MWQHSNMSSPPYARETWQHSRCQVHLILGRHVTQITGWLIVIIGAEILKLGCASHLTNPYMISVIEWSVNVHLLKWQALRSDITSSICNCFLGILVWHRNVVDTKCDIDVTSLWIHMNMNVIFVIKGLCICLCVCSSVHPSAYVL